MRRFLASLLLTTSLYAQQLNPNQVKGTAIVQTPTAGQSITQAPQTFTNMNALSADSNFITANAKQGLILRAWGNSQTAGFGLPDCPTTSCTSVYAWPSILAQNMGWTVDNQAVSSTECAQLSTVGHSESMWDLGALQITDASRTAYGHFRNEQANYGPLPYRVDYARGCIQAEIAWLAIPEYSSNTQNPSKFRAVNSLVTKVGTWTSVGEPNSASMSTSQAGAQMLFNLRGTSLYIAAARINGSTATYKINVDGTDVFDPVTQSTTFSQSLDTSDSQMPYMIRVPNLPNGHHVLTYTCVSPGSGVCRVFYAAGVQTDNSTANGPIVYTMSPVNNADAQATGNMQFAFTQLYLNEWHRIISELSADGLQVVGLDVTNLNVYFADAQNIGDGIHPNVAGHQSIANAMTSKATLASTPRERTESKIFNTAGAYGGFGAGPSPSPSGAGSTNPSYNIPPGILWSSTAKDQGIMYFGYDGQGLLQRVSDDPTNANGFGQGRIFAFNGADGNFSNLIGNQFTSNIAINNLSIGFKANNGAVTGGGGFGYLGHAGPSPAVGTWANRAVLFNGGGSLGWVYNATSASGDHQFQISSNTVASITTSGFQFNKLNNGTGMQIASGSICATGASTACAVSISIPITEPDTAYKVLGCEVSNNATGTPIPSSTSNTSVSAFSIVIANVATGAATTTGTVSCIVIHN